MLIIESLSRFHGVNGSLEEARGLEGKLLNPYKNRKGLATGKESRIWQESKQNELVYGVSKTFEA